MRRSLTLIALLAALAGCASPCERVALDFRQLNADVIRDPAMAVDGRYTAEFQDIAARSVEHGCLLDSDR